MSERVYDRFTAEALARDEGVTAAALARDVVTMHNPTGIAASSGAPSAASSVFIEKGSAKEGSSPLTKGPKGFDPYLMNDGKGPNDSRLENIGKPGWDCIIS